MINYGSDPRNDQENKDSKFLTVKDGQSVDVIILVNKEEIATCNQAGIFNYNGQSVVWVYNGATDPANELGIKPFYRAFVPVLYNNEVVYWGMSKQVYAALLDTAEAMEVTLKGQGLRVKRNGSGLQTNYTLALRGKKSYENVEIPSIENLINVWDVDEVREKVVSILKFNKWEDVVNAVGKKNSKAKPQTSRLKIDTADLYKKLLSEQETEETKDEDIPF